MASSIVWRQKTVFGNMRVQLGYMTATDGTDVLESGMKWIDVGFVTQATATNQSGLGINTAASSAGSFKLVTGTSGGTYHIMLIGR